MPFWVVPQDCLIAYEDTAQYQAPPKVADVNVDTTTPKKDGFPTRDTLAKAYKEGPGGKHFICIHRDSGRSNMMGINALYRHSASCITLTGSDQVPIVLSMHASVELPFMYPMLMFAVSLGRHEGRHGRGGDGVCVLKERAICCANQRGTNEAIGKVSLRRCERIRACDQRTLLPSACCSD